MATTGSLNGLQSDKSAKRLKQISALRGLGIDNSIDLPQLVVCGDQSSGKSSVLEGLTGIPFPRDDGVCTRFPTEIIITHDETRPQTITASIIPFSNTHRPSETLKSLKDFNRSITTFEQLPKTIAEAGSLMGLRGYGEKNEDGPSFGRDVLQIKVSNQSGQHLSIVDLPGLISVASDVQTEADVEIVHQTVTSYIEKPRTIILAVVQAGNDIANQSIIKESKRFDKSGERTVGIITKPDLINLGTEARIAALANNKDTTKLQLGFFIVKNPSPLEIQAKITATEREANEQRFFQSPPWKGRLDSEKVGIIKLKQYLQKLLDSHIEKELPKVRHDMKTKIRTATDALAMLPVDRPTPADKRIFLSELAGKYQRLLNAALNGEYGSTGGDFFAASGHDIGPTRLRALVHDVNTDFADYMREKGPRPRVPRERQKNSPSPATDIHPEYDDDVTFLTEDQMKLWVLQMHRRSRGKELSGNFNAVLLAELFHHECRRWVKIASAHIEQMYSLLIEFNQILLDHLRMEPRVQNEIHDRIQTNLQSALDSAHTELKQLWEDESLQPITYNHYYTDNVQKANLGEAKRRVKAAMSLNGAAKNPSEDENGENLKPITVAALFAAMEERLVVDMDEQACKEALASLDAYYKVAMKTWVDNVCRQVIERRLLRILPSIFSPQLVAGYSDEELDAIAGEGFDVVEKRKQLKQELQGLQAGMDILKR
ncbi:uncharacterized protein K489DRAFT_389167 [Dissoconium aciculare CBS 342.82]|uniref:Dynamin family protein n=1 Tax=Dissoconium aciculare CBS 342.82 TaxID=1314786 RepID=A0A6J3M5Y5_9PEZI|nr:uncharacterized protein K489DRAFT_389167 [Dissoconium aciculare CBS 342.82]KAF1822262.1 hypothetical protein K489DRAFT_389167 [Dissoconium aciculare CBS 342.82]